MLPEFYGPMTAESLQIDLEIAATLGGRQLGHRAGRTEGLILSYLTDRIAVAVGVAPAARRHEGVDFFLEGSIAADDGTDILHSHAMSVDVDMQATAAVGGRTSVSQCMATVQITADGIGKLAAIAAIKTIPHLDLITVRSCHDKGHGKRPGFLRSLTH